MLLNKFTATIFLSLISALVCAQDFSISIKGGRSVQSANGFSVETNGLLFELLPTKEGSNFFYPELEFSYRPLDPLNLHFGVNYGKYVVSVLAEDLNSAAGGGFTPLKARGEGYAFIGFSTSVSCDLVNHNKLRLAPMLGLLTQHGLDGGLISPTDLPFPDFERRVWNILEQTKSIINPNQLLYQFGIKVSYYRYSISYSIQRAISDSLGSLQIEGTEVDMFNKRSFKVLSLGIEVFRY